MIKFDNKIGGKIEESNNKILFTKAAPEKENTRADVYADILNIEDIKIEEK